MTAADTAATVVEKEVYLNALATHEEVVEKPGVFWETLKCFHSMLGTKFMVPVIGGEELDLHTLYVEVTRRGGYDKVVLEKRWTEISGVFKFGPTTTSASHVLKKHYHSLLLHFEHVYFFGFQPPSFNSSGRHVSVVDRGGEEEYLSKRGEDTFGVDYEGPMSTEATGTIHAKLDVGYLITVNLGSETLQGLLYHPQDFTMAIVPYNPIRNGKIGKRKIKKKRWGGDPNHPKPNRSGYNFFFAEKHSVLKSLYPNQEREFTKMIGRAWTQLSFEDKMIYQNIGLRDKERYKRELKEYEENLRLKQQFASRGGH